MSPPGRALVIGNTDGIGLALTRRLLSKGWVVAGVSRRASPLEAPEYSHAVVDVATADYRSTLQSLLALQGPFDVCVYCSGIGDLFDAGDLSKDANTFSVNLLGAVETAATILPSMITARRGHFVGLSSIADGASAAAPSYSASKAGLSAYLEGLALALRPTGVSVTNVRLGFVDTKMAKSKTRPFLLNVEQAVDVILRCLARRPARMTVPKRMNALMAVLRGLTAIRLWWA
jgi:NAD(P)-dependent dehydrogenase (short-subunit alcohol dehydrogenase family)